MVNNVNIDITDVNTEVTFHSGSGTSTETDKYLNIGYLCKKVHIANDKAFVIVAVNGTDFTNPKSVSAGVGFSLKTHAFETISSIKIRTTTTSSHFEVMMW